MMPVGSDAPAFTLTGDDGSTVSVQASSGEPTILAFIETGCSSCKAEAPLLADLARSGGHVVAVDVSRAGPEERAAFARDDLGGVVPVAADDGTVGRAYRALVVPTVPLPPAVPDAIEVELQAAVAAPGATLEAGTAYVQIRPGL